MGIREDGKGDRTAGEPSPFSLFAFFPFRLFPFSSFPLRHREVRGYAFFFALVYFVQGSIDLTSGLANQPVQYLLKDNMGLTAAQSGFFFAIVGLGWMIKPVYGLLSDFFPLAGYQRKGYLLLMGGSGNSQLVDARILPALLLCRAHVVDSLCRDARFL